jgi:hypothetical protein
MGEGVDPEVRPQVRHLSRRQDRAKRVVHAQGGQAEAEAPVSIALCWPLLGFAAVCIANAVDQSMRGADLRAAKRARRWRCR